MLCNEIIASTAHKAITKREENVTNGRDRRGDLSGLFVRICDTILLRKYGTSGGWSETLSMLPDAH